MQKQRATPALDGDAVRSLWERLQRSPEPVVWLQHSGSRGLLLLLLKISQDSTWWLLSKMMQKKPTVALALALLVTLSVTTRGIYAYSADMWSLGISPTFSVRHRHGLRWGLASKRALFVYLLVCWFCLRAAVGML
jgi:hypothetical protein